ncbi:DUF6774 domain-containing protein [Anaerotignum sp. MB30-C6]|uniref:DUF6774 domain-containing protein n=1 Tax=Anaerotignum sp. MB30-C6 TaxID=3070814 RepID=UPI0027DBF502|nr:DUF6774 domain-containing protein [Anaerotignum sp. MB30-C6]WMI82077.1 hypothetical protein RBQ60_04910 [Anaerotignum sp. MB30-C6]
MENCPDVVAITMLACKISECLSEEELETLAADLNLLSDAISSILVRKSLNKNTEPNDG